MYEAEGLNGANRKIQIDYGIKSVSEQFDVIESMYLKKNKYMLGNEVHFIDYYIGIILSVLDKVEFDFSKWPQMSKWYSIMKDEVSCMIQKFQSE